MERTTPNPVLRAARQSLQWPKIPKKRDGHLDGKVHLLIRIGALICNGISIGLLFYVKKKYGTHETLGFAAAGFGAALEIITIILILCFSSFKLIFDAKPIHLAQTLSTAEGLSMVLSLFAVAQLTTKKYGKDQNGSPWIGVSQAAVVLLYVGKGQYMSAKSLFRHVHYHNPKGRTEDLESEQPRGGSMSRSRSPRRDASVATVYRETREEV